MQGVGALLHGLFVRALQLAILVGVAGLAHDQHLDLVPVLDRLRQGAAAGNLDIVQVGAHCQYFHFLPLSAARSAAR